MSKVNLVNELDEFFNLDTTKKLDALQNYVSTDIKRKQIVFLNANGFTAEKIAEITKYAISTVKTYIKKFANLLDEAIKLFKKISIKLKQEVVGRTEQVYLFKFYFNNHIVCSKVGTTTRLAEQRMKEELKYYEKHGMKIDDYEICSVIDCGDIPAEGAESYTRAQFIKRFPKAFVKNDRFFDVDIPTRTFNKMVAEYLG